jgi:hypothetical protein
MGVELSAINGKQENDIIIGNVTIPYVFKIFASMKEIFVSWYVSGITA